MIYMCVTFQKTSQGERRRHVRQTAGCKQAADASPAFVVGWVAAGLEEACRGVVLGNCKSDPLVPVVAYRRMVKSAHGGRCGSAAHDGRLAVEPWKTQMAFDDEAVVVLVAVSWTCVPSCGQEPSMLHQHLLYMYRQKIFPADPAWRHASIVVLTR